MAEKKGGKVQEKKENKKNKEFVWKGLRIGFWTMVVTFLISFFSAKMPLWLANAVSIICYISILFTFIISIIHLTKYKEKTFAIITLVISSLIILLLFFGLLLISIYSQIVT